ncbi:unnamed protein product [Lampetra planeri]
MGNGSMKTHPLRDPDAASMAPSGPPPQPPTGGPGSPQGTLLRAELRQREAQVRDLEVRVLGLEAELRHRTVQVSRARRRLQEAVRKLQEAIGHTSGAPTGPLGPPSLLPGSGCLPSLLHAVQREPGPRPLAKAGVSAEPASSSSLPRQQLGGAACWARVHKNPCSQRLIKAALAKNEFLRRLEDGRVTRMVECMYERAYSPEQAVVREGEAGNHLYVLAEGVVEMQQRGTCLGHMHPGTVFGELAILYNCKRTATVKAVTAVRVWVLDRLTFQAIVIREEQARHQEHVCFLRSVSLLRQLPEEKLARIVDCMEVESYVKGEYIIRQGEEGSTFFIIARGSVRVTQAEEGRDEPRDIEVLGVGRYFGEKALISKDVRSANIIAADDAVECLVIDHQTFVQTVGTMEELQEYVALLAQRDQQRSAPRPQSQLSPATLDEETTRLMELLSALPTSDPRTHMDVIATLGVGGFGRVQLVKLKESDVTFALKCLKKKFVVESKQQEHVYSEKRILQECSSPFIVRFYRTFRDQKFVFLLMEACLGGELWSVLRDSGGFQEVSARFCVACVVEALAYLHARGILYRDLKPENLLLDARGYVKMADFGFAKKLACGRKAWTFCGTPEYVCPEMIVNRGHDRGADCWALGVLVYELLAGVPPFSGTDPMKTYNAILWGMERVHFPNEVGKRAEDIIRRLCRQNPSERLGNQKHGVGDVRKHKWFQGFDWEGLRANQLASPLKREVSGPTDFKNFDWFPEDLDVPPDETSGWDHDF